MKKIYILGAILLGIISIAGCSNKEDISKERIIKKSLIAADEKNKPTTLGEYDVLFKANSIVPYIKITDGVSIMSDLRKTTYPSANAYYKATKENDDLVIKNENGASCKINLKNQTFKYDDFDLFSGISNENQKPLALLNYSKDTKAYKSLSSEYKAGKPVTVNLNDYSSLDIYDKDGELYIPVTVYNSLLFSLNKGVNFAYNYKDLYIIADDQLTVTVIGIKLLTDFGKKYYNESLKMESISEALVDYNYQSLCLEFDLNYGLENKFDSLDKYLTNNGYDKDIKSTNPKTIDNGLAIALSYIGDGHTAFDNFSTFYDNEGGAIDEKKLNPVPVKNEEKQEELKENKYETRKVFGKDYKIPIGIEYGEETAIVNFDDFNDIKENVLYEEKDDEVRRTSTAAIFADLYSGLKKAENSKIKNVVVDLTTNGGGSSDALIYSASILVGEVTVNIADPLTGALNVQKYKADMNLDGSVDDKDVSLVDKGYNVYILSSAYSFSSANALPALATLNSDKVITLGAKTAGGPCAICSYYTGIGSSLYHSSLTTISKLKDGKYVNIDDGVEAKYTLTEAQMIDREYLLTNISKWV